MSGPGVDGSEGEWVDGRSRAALKPVPSRRLEMAQRRESKRESLGITGSLPVAHQRPAESAGGRAVSPVLSRGPVLGITPREPPHQG